MSYQSADWYITLESICWTLASEMWFYKRVVTKPRIDNKFTEDNLKKVNHNVDCFLASEEVICILWALHEVCGTQE